MKIRNCAWLGQKAADEKKRVIWARKETLTYQCPKSVISSQSIHFLDTFRYLQQANGALDWSMEAKTADAMVLLRQLWKAEEQHGR